MRLGISGVLPRDPAALDLDALRRARELGFRAVALPFGARTGEIDGALAARIRDLLEEAGLRPVELGHYHTSLIDPDPAERARQIDEVRRACRVAATLGRPPVIIGSGSLNSLGAFLPHRDNHRAEVRDRLVASLREAVKGAEDSGVVLGLEPHTVTVLKDAETTKAIVDAVGSPMLRVHVDPVNWVTFDTIYDTGALLDRIFDALPARYVLGLHAKGVRIEDRLIFHIDETYAGAPDDLLDYRAFLRRAAALGPDADLVIEHTPPERIPEVRDYLLRVAGEAGITIEAP